MSVPDAGRRTNGTSRDATSPFAFAEALRTQGQVLDVMAVRLADGRTPGPGALEEARSAAAGEAGDARAFFATVDGGDAVGVVLAPRRSRATLREVGDAAARRSGLAIGLATNEDHKSLALDDLVAVAIEGLEVACASESLTAVHSELYELVARIRGARGGSFEIDGDVTSDVIPAQPPPAYEANHAPAEARGKRTEVDDPFAFIDTNDKVLDETRATKLTRGIAPTTIALQRMEKEQIAERDALRAEIEGLREEHLHLRRGQESERRILERRIDKLARQLDEAEEEIDRLRQARDEDLGVASTFRTVQGLPEDSPNRAVKEGALGSVFDQNNRSGPGAQESSQTGR